MSELMKAWKNGKRGKFRRVDGGKMKFIRSEDGKVEKDITSQAGMNADLGSPSSEVMASGGLKAGKKSALCKCGMALEKCSCKKSLAKEFPAEREAYAQDDVAVCKSCGKTAEEGCTHGVEKNAKTCDCTHEGVCKEASDCGCDCTDRAACEYRVTNDLDKVLKTLKARAGVPEAPEGQCPTCGRE